MTPRETLAAWVREHLPEEWDGEHDAGDWYRCVHCHESPLYGGKTPLWESPCPGPDFTQDTDVLLRMFQALCLTKEEWEDLYWRIFDEIGIEKFQEALLAAVLAALEEK